MSNTINTVDNSLGLIYPFMIIYTGFVILKVIMLIGIANSVCFEEHISYKECLGGRDCKENWVYRKEFKEFNFITNIHNYIYLIKSCQVHGFQ
jgi:hypothetical protein